VQIEIRNSRYVSVFLSERFPSKILKTKTYRPIILPVVLFRYEIWSLILK